MKPNIQSFLNFYVDIEIYISCYLHVTIFWSKAIFHFPRKTGNKCWVLTRSHCSLNLNLNDGNDTMDVNRNEADNGDKYNFNYDCNYSQHNLPAQHNMVLQCHRSWHHFVVVCTTHTAPVLQEVDSSKRIYSNKSTAVHFYA